MTLGDSKLTDADKTVHLARFLVTEKRRGLVITKRQIAVRKRAVKICLILERAGHGTKCEALLLLIIRVAQNEHTVKIMIPMSRKLVKLTLCHIRSLGDLPAAASLFILNKAL